jgi:hypothetical protein
VTLVSPWLLRAAGYDRRRERVLAEASRGAERRALQEESMAEDISFSEAMERLSRQSSVELGTTASGVPYRIALDDLVSLPAWITGGTGSGKTRFVGSFVARILSQLMNGAPVSIVVVDGKGETVDHLLRSTAALVERLPPGGRGAALSQIQTLRFFGRAFLPSWPLLEPLPDVPIATQADAVAEVLSELATDATVGPRQRSTLAAVLALAIEFRVPAVALPWLLAAPTEVTTLAAQSSLPSVRLDLSRFEREPQASVDGLVARLGTLLRVPAIKAVLSGETPFDFGTCFEPGTITALGFDGADLGARSAVRALGSLAISALANAAFDPRRQVRGKTIILLDEPQTFLTSVSLAQLERLVTLGRSFGAGGVFFIHQGPGQLPQEFGTLLTTNIPLRVIGRSSEQDALGSAEWLPRTGRVPRPRDMGSRGQGMSRFFSEGEERRFRALEIGRLPERRFLVADRRAPFGSRIVRAPDYDPPTWQELNPSTAEAVQRGASGVSRTVLEARVAALEEASAARFEPAIQAAGGSRRRGRTAVTPDVVGGDRTGGSRGEIP